MDPHAYQPVKTRRVQTAVSCTHDAGHKRRVVVEEDYRTQLHFVLARHNAVDKHVAVAADHDLLRSRVVPGKSDVGTD